MTVRYLGMNSQTGLSIAERSEHIRQSVRDILGHTDWLARHAP